LRCFLAGNGCKGSDPALSLEAQQSFVKPPAEQHGPVELEQQFIGDIGFKGLIHVPFLVQDGKVFHMVRKIHFASWHDSTPFFVNDATCRTRKPYGLSCAFEMNIPSLAKVT
jgi:hypothetical protein